MKSIVHAIVLITLPLCFILNLGRAVLESMFAFTDALQWTRLIAAVLLAVGIILEIAFWLQGRKARTNPKDSVA